MYYSKDRRNNFPAGEYLFITGDTSQTIMEITEYIISTKKYCITTMYFDDDTYLIQITMKHNSEWYLCATINSDTPHTSKATFLPALDNDTREGLLAIISAED